MRTTGTTLVVLALVAMVSAQQVISNFEEFQRKKAEYDRQKAKYDEFQALAGVPLLASYDLIPKGRDADAAPGKAEQLLPNYTGIPINFQMMDGPSLIEPGNTAQNFFHTGPIPEKKSSSPSPGPVVIPTGPGQDFIIPKEDSSGAVTMVTATSGEAAPTPSPSALDSSTSGLAPSPAPAPAPATPSVSFNPSGSALFFGRGALSALQADAPFRASVQIPPAGGRTVFAVQPLRFQLAAPPRSLAPSLSVFGRAAAPIFRFQPAAVYGPPTRSLRR